MRYSLRDIAEIGAGQGAPQGDSNYCNDGIPFVKAGNLESLTTGGSLSQIQKVSDTVAKAHRLKLYSKGTVLFAKSGMSCLKGYVYVLPQEAYVVSHLACITPKEDISEYLRYYFTYHKPNQLVKDAAYPSISLSDIGALEIDTKDEKTRADIISVLQSVEQIIGLRKQVLAALDDLIKARFVEMFGNPIINEKGFETKLGSDVFNLSNGKFVPESKRFEDGVPVYGGNGVSWYTDEILFESDTIVIGRVGFQSGNVHLVNGPLWISDNAMFISKLFDNGFDLRFLYFVMEHIDFTRFQDAGDLKKITQKPFMAMSFIKPPLSMQLDYIAFVSQIDKSKDAVKKALAKTQLLFDSLMQEYFG